MLRIVDDDFKLLLEFVKTYSLSHLETDKTACDTTKLGHKIYISFLHLWAQCLFLSKSGRLIIGDKKIAITSTELSFLREATSDFGSAFFCCLHGAYKPGYISLRSGIENFLRFKSGPFDPNALTTTSVVRLFEIAKKSESISSSDIKFINDLHGIYKELCMYTHSSSLKHMSHIHALSYFPAFSDTDFKKWVKLAERACRSMCASVFCSNYNIYAKAHYQVKEVFDLMLSSEIKIRLMGGPAD